jgi:hypothetical protein
MMLLCLRFSFRWFHDQAGRKRLNGNQGLAKAPMLYAL